SRYGSLTGQGLPNLPVRARDPLRMVGQYEKRRLVMAASPAEGALARQLLIGSVHDAWDSTIVHSFAQARFVLHHQPCGALLIEDPLYREEGAAALDWLTSQREAPVVFLAGPTPHIVADALARGIEYWLPCEAAVAQPSLFKATLDQAVRASELRRQIRRV